MTSKRVAVVTLGCKVNTYDSAALSERLRLAGCRIVDVADGADVVVVNSCTVTNAADTESQRQIRRASRRNPTARIVVTGCWAQTTPETAARLDAVTAVVGTGQPDAVVRAVLAKTPDGAPRVSVGNVRRLEIVDTVGARHFEGQTRAFLKVQEGCDLFCTFCIVPRARGRSRSLTPRAILTEIEALARVGFQEVVLTGVHLGGYGRDLDPPVDLPWLLDAVAEQGLVPRIRLSSIDPHEVTEALVRRVATIPALCPHFHVPLQAGDDDTLVRMRRRNTVALAHERLAMIRTLLPDASIGTDVIAGFPGESKAAFLRTAEFLAASPVTYAHVFPYSIRTGTTAAKLPDHVPRATIHARARHLRRIATAKQRAFVQRSCGTEAEVLVEHQRDPTTNRLRGYTRNYLRVRLDGPDGLKGTRTAVRLVAHGSDLSGTVLA